ncbi:MAG: transposase, partial [Burkholderiaceae bacterium]
MLIKTAWRDWTTNIVMPPLEFMQRLAALVPRPRVHFIRFHGVLAPNAKPRAMVVPHGLKQATGKSELTATEPGCAHGRPARISWARLLKRVFQIDLEHCPNCGGEIKIIAV